MKNFRTYLKQIGLYDLTSLDVIFNKVESQSQQPNVSDTEKMNLTVILMIMSVLHGRVLLTFVLIWKS